MDPKAKTGSDLKGEFIGHQNDFAARMRQRARPRVTWVVQVETHGLHGRLAQAAEVVKLWQRCRRIGGGDMVRSHWKSFLNTKTQQTLRAIKYHWSW